MSHTSASLSDRIRLILRRDLKVAASIPLEDDTPLFGSHTDLDSLDALLLVSSIEKELGYKIPNERIGRETFRTIGTLAAFLAANLHEAPVVASAQSPIDKNGALARLPHGQSFRFITALTSLEPGVQGEGVWEITGSEAFLAGHFPGDPIVPGVLIVEALAQLSGVIAAASIAGKGVKAGRIAQVEVRFEREVRPTVQLRLRSGVSQRMEGLWRFDVSAAVGEDVVSQGQITMSVS